MTAALYWRRTTPATLAPASEWVTGHLAEIEHAAGTRANELLGYVLEVALSACYRGDLEDLTPARAVKRARKRVEDECLVTRPRGDDRPEVAGGDVIDAIESWVDPVTTMVTRETERAREHDDCDHDDRMSRAAVRAAAGHQPVELPHVARDSAARQARRFRVRARDLRDSGQGDFWIGWEQAA